MKIFMCEWVGGYKNLPTWFKHKEEAEVTWEQIAELYATGINVMVAHRGDGLTLVAVDDRLFTQR